MKLIKTALLLSAFSMASYASELDPTPARPNSVVVREDAQGNREVFKADLTDAVTTDAQAAAALQVLTDANKVTVLPGSELDQGSSQEAWYYWNYGYGYGYNGYSSYYGYSYRGYSYYYYPTYSYCYGSYRYWYYRY